MLLKKKCRNNIQSDIWCKHFIENYKPNILKILIGGNPVVIIKLMYNWILQKIVDKPVKIIFVILL